MPHSITPPVVTSFITVTVLFSLSTFFFAPTVLCKKPHIIKFRSPNLYPEGLTWDPSAQHFLVGSYQQRTISSVSDAGVTETFISDPTLPENVTVLGLTVDTRNQRLLAVLHAIEPLPQFDALAAYDLNTRRRIFLSVFPIDSDEKTRPIANDVAVDYKGNAFVTNAGNNYIWKINDKGEASFFSRSPLFTSFPVDRDEPYSFCGLNGIAYVMKGYLLVVQSNTGKMFKVDEEDGRARHVLLNKDLTMADDIVIRRDGVVLVLSMNHVWFLKSDSSWSEGVVFDETDLDVKRFATSLVVGDEERVYALYGHQDEALRGEFGREIFGIEQVWSKREIEDEEHVWVYVLIGLGLAYFLFWRFQMRQLVAKMDKKLE